MVIEASTIYIVVSEDPLIAPWAVPARSEEEALGKLVKAGYKLDVESLRYHKLADVLEN